MRKNLGIRDAARRLGLAHTTVGRYVRAHPELNRGSRGRPRVDLDELRRHRAANTNPSRRGSHAGKLLGEGEGEGNKNGTAPSYVDSKALREAVLAERAQIDLDEKRGLLVPRAEIESAIYDAGTVLQRDLLELGAQLSEQIAAMDDPREIAALLETELRRVLATMVSSLRAKVESEQAETKARATGEVIPISDPRPST